MDDSSEPEPRSDARPDTHPDTHPDTRRAAAAAAEDAHAIAGGYRPVLSRVPDARMARAPLFHPVLFGYLALGLGSAVAAATALYNAALLRRWRLVVIGISLGAVGWLGFRFLVAGLYASGFQNIPLLLLAGRLFHVAVGVLLAVSQWAHFRGHVFLGGKAVPLIGVVIAGVALQLALPAPLLHLFLGL